MNVYITPPITHFDRGVGFSAWQFKDSAELLLNSENPNDIISPICYLQRHAIELYLKSIIYILHKKYSIRFGEEGNSIFSLDNPAFLKNDDWKPLKSSHDLSDLYQYLKTLLNTCRVHGLLPEIIASWEFSDNFLSKINKINGYDPKSTYFRYPDSGPENQDRKKSTIQSVGKDKFLEEIGENQLEPVKRTIMFDAEDNILDVYDIAVDPIIDLRKALSEIVDELHNFHLGILAELTNFT